MFTKNQHHLNIMDIHTFKYNILSKDIIFRKKSISSLILFLSLIFPLTILADNKYLDFEMPYNFPADSLIEQQLPIEEQWWLGFNDPLLDSLMVVAIDKNYNLLMAQQKIYQAKAAMRSAYGALFPTLGLDVGWERVKSSKNISEAAKLSDPYSGYYSGTVTMSWEVDVFGSIRKKAREEKMTYRATKAEYNATMVSMAASLGTAYVNLRTTQRVIAVMNENINSQKEILDITIARFNAGLSSQLDVSQAKSTYYSTQASILSYYTSEASYINAIAILLGAIPSSVTELLSVTQPFPKPDRLIPTSIPAALLRQRPDIKEAEYQVEAQAAALGVARAEWFPTFFVNGEFGVSTHDLDKLLYKNSMVWEIAPAMKWTIFNGGQRAAGVTSAKALLESSIENYNQTVLTALQEVDNAIISYKNAVRESQQYNLVVNEAQTSLKLAVELYKMGLTEFLNVIDSLQSLLTYQISLVNAEGNTVIDMITLYQALGGGWEINN